MGTIKRTTSSKRHIPSALWNDLVRTYKNVPHGPPVDHKVWVKQVDGLRERLQRFTFNEAEAGTDMTDASPCTSSTPTATPVPSTAPPTPSSGQSITPSSSIWGDAKLMLPPPEYTRGGNIELFAGLICFQCLESRIRTPVRPVRECSGCEFHYCHRHLRCHDGCTDKTVMKARK